MKFKDEDILITEYEENKELKIKKKIKKLDIKR